MGSFCTSDPPQPPDPVQVAGAQTATNVNTALANAFLNNVNQVTPLGSLTYSSDPSQNYTFTDPTTNTPYSIPRFTVEQKLSGTQQQIQNQNQQAQINLSGAGQNESNYLLNALGTPFNLNNAPAAGSSNMLRGIPGAATSYGDAGGLVTSLGNYGQQQGTFGDAGGITSSYGPTDNFSADRGRVEEALYGRLNPQLDRERGNIEQRLADQGIRYGSQAYHSAMDDYNRQANDARLAVTAAGGAEQQRMNDMAAQQAGFQNAAQRQAYEQAQGRGTFANTAQAQQFQEQTAAGQFTNTAQQALYSQLAGRATFQNAGQAQQLAQQQAILNAQNQERANYLSEQYALRGQPINEVSALLSGSQVHQPTFVNTPTNQIPTTDIAGLLNNNFQQNLDIYKQQSANTNALVGGTLGAVGNIYRGTSDRRAKEDIVKMGTVFAADDEGAAKNLPIYEYSYKKGFEDDGAQRHVGPMAQDVEKIDPGAVSRDSRGIRRLDMPRVAQHIRMGSILNARRAA